MRDPVGNASQSPMGSAILVKHMLCVQFDPPTAKPVSLQVTSPSQSLIRSAARSPVGIPYRTTVGVYHCDRPACRKCFGIVRHCH